MTTVRQRLAVILNDLVIDAGMSRLGTPHHVNSAVHMVIATQHEHATSDAAVQRAQDASGHNVTDDMMRAAILAATRGET